MKNSNLFLIFILSCTSSTMLAWHNWAGNHECRGEIVYPQTKNELITIITDAAAKNRKIRVVGAGHSLNDIACCDDILISLKNLTRII